MNKVLITLFSALLVIPATTQITYAQAQPVCQYADSDPDGDGFGWENRTSCVVTDQSTQIAPTMCIDDDGDGFGFNGREVCRVDVADCFDSDPIGDGWGWNGVTSCEIVAFPAPFSELAVLREQNRTLDGESIAVASLICAWEGDFQVFDLFENGTVSHQGSGRPGFGVWTTGFSDTDGVLDVWLTGSIITRQRVVMQPGSVVLRDNNPRFNSDDCFWAS